jgi:hypothetical protein
VTVRDLRSVDWPEVARIFEQGIATGNATFEVEVPSWEAWDAAHLRDHRFVAAFFAISLRCSGVSFAALALPPTSPPRRPSDTAAGSRVSPASGLRSPIASSTMSLASCARSSLRFLDRSGIAEV